MTKESIGYASYSPILASCCFRSRLGCQVLVAENFDGMKVRGAYECSTGCIRMYFWLRVYAVGLKYPISDSTTELNDFFDVVLGLPR